MSNNVSDKLIAARIRLLSECPFFGNLAMRLQIVQSEEIPTAATDGYKIYYNEEFFLKLSHENIKFIVAHEIMHIVYNHFNRVGSRDKFKWNVAGDYVINWELNEAGIGELPPKNLIELCYDQKYKDMYTEQVYDILQEEGDDMESMDCHIIFDTDGSAKIMMPDGTVIDSEEIDGIDPSAMDEKGEEMQRIIIQAAQSASASDKKTPGQIRDMIADFINPVMDWRAVLLDQVSYQVSDDFTFTRRSKKSISTEWYLPGKDNDTEVEVTCAIDTSGSMSVEMLRDFLGEVRGIVEQYQNYKINVLCFDTQCYNYQTFTPDNIHEIGEYEMMGFGGTNFEVIWDFLEESGVPVKQLVVFTDGYPCSSWGDEDAYETVFLIHSYPDKRFEAPFGVTLHYENT